MSKLKQTLLTINSDGSSALTIDGVQYGLYSVNETPTVRLLLLTLQAREADINVLEIVQK